jgi:hypothetical protein
MRIMRPMMLVVGILAGLTGLIWIGQGSGYFPYPSGSFMVGEPRWALRGAGMIVIGLAAVIFSRRV